MSLFDLKTSRCFKTIQYSLAMGRVYIEDYKKLKDGLGERMKQIEITEDIFILEDRTSRMAGMALST